MFSENQKISAKQMRALLLTDWMGKLLLLAPDLLGKAGGGNGVAGVLAGTALTLGIGWAAAGTGRDKNGDYYGQICRAAGKPAACALFFLIILYLIGQAALAFYLCGQIAGTYLLPETNEALVILIPALLGYYLASGGLETAGRVSELTAFLLWGLFFLMLALTLPQIQPNLLAESMEPVESGIWKAAGYTALAGFSTVSVLPLILPQIIDPRDETAEKTMQAILMGGLLLLLSVTAGYGIFGAEGMGRLRWPVIALMSCTNLQGVFLQRWDVLLIGLLVFSLFLSAGSSIFYTGMAGERLGMARKPVFLAATVLGGLLAFWMEKNPAAAKLHSRIVFGVLAPVLAAAVVLLALFHRKERKAHPMRQSPSGSGGQLFSKKAGKGRKRLYGLALLLAAIPVFLGGCTARELESRRFPLALEVGSRDGKLTFACAWPYVDGGTQEENGESVNMDEAEIGENINEDWKVNNDKLTEVLAENVDDAVKKIQNLQDKYVDYSQVKAILWDRSLEKDSPLGEQVLEWLEKNPVFARNILIFDTDREKLSLELVQKESQGQPGIYLENLYRNNTDYQESTKTLREVLYQG